MHGDEGRTSNQFHETSGSPRKIVLLQVHILSRWVKSFGTRPNTFAPVQAVKMWNEDPRVQLYRIYVDCSQPCLTVFQTVFTFVVLPTRLDSERPQFGQRHRPHQVSNYRVICVGIVFYASFFLDCRSALSSKDVHLGDIDICSDLDPEVYVCEAA